MGFARDIANRVCFLDQGRSSRRGHRRRSSAARGRLGRASSLTASSRPAAWAAATDPGGRLAARVLEPARPERLDEVHAEGALDGRRAPSGRPPCRGRARARPHVRGDRVHDAAVQAVEREMSRNTSPAGGAPAARRRVGQAAGEVDRRGSLAQPRAASKNAGPASGPRRWAPPAGRRGVSRAMPLAWAAAMMSFARSMRSCASVGIDVTRAREHERHPLAGAHVQHVRPLQARGVEQRRRAARPGAVQDADARLDHRRVGRVERERHAAKGPTARTTQAIASRRGATSWSISSTLTSSQSAPPAICRCAIQGTYVLPARRAPAAVQAVTHRDHDVLHAALAGSRWSR